MKGQRRATIMGIHDRKRQVAGSTCPPYIVSSATDQRVATKMLLTSQYMLYGGLLTAPP